MSPQILLAIVTGVLGLMTAGILALVNSWITTRAGIDENLRSQRRELYPARWSASAAISRWPRVEVTRGSLDELHQTLRSWYYASGGLFLSDSARARYGDVQQLIEALLTHQGDPDRRLTSNGYIALMETASAMRTGLTQDLDTRRRTSLRESWRRARWHAHASRKAQIRIQDARHSPNPFAAQ
jgi:hypothetical protein